MEEDGSGIFWSKYANYCRGPWEYRAAIAEAPIMIAGKRRLGLCVEAERVILICPECPARSRLKVLLHELTHAWIFETGEPATIEAWCDLVATVAAAFNRDLAVNGGETALVRLGPGESPEPAAARVPLTRHRQCACCGGSVAGASVVCERDRDKPGEATLRLFCEHCDHLQVWREVIDGEGRVTGEVIGEPVMLRGKELEMFLRAHGEGMGVRVGT